MSATRLRSQVYVYSWTEDITIFIAGNDVPHSIVVPNSATSPRVFRVIIEDTQPQLAHYGYYMLLDWIIADNL